MQLNRLIKYDEAVKITAFLKENGLDHLDFSILTEVDDKRILDKINEEEYIGNCKIVQMNLGKGIGRVLIKPEDSVFYTIL